MNYDGMLQFIPYLNEWRAVVAFNFLLHIAVISLFILSIA